jgi:site-specific DNA recombinase
MAVIQIPAGSHGIVYVRVSTEHQASDELPIASQVAELTAAVERAGATCDVVQDAGISGTDLEGRQGLQSIISRAREGGPSFSWVLVWKFSRFARNMEEGLVYRALLRKRGIDILSYKEPVPEGPLGSLITHILMAVDEFYAAATAADVLRSQKELARQGFSAGGRPPVGYRREPIVIGARYDGTPLTRVRWVPDPETAPKVVQAFQMAAEGVTYDEIVAATGICENKSSLATILANPIYRGVRVFNREARVEGEHGRRRRRNPAEDVVTSEVEAVVPEQLWTRVQEMLVRRRKDRLAPQRYAGGYVLTELLRCACGSPMVGTSNRSYRYYRCKARCGRPSVRANDLDAGVMDLIRRTLVTPKAVRDMVHLLNEDIQMRAERRAPDLDEAKARIRKLQQEDANLRRALRSAGPRASERINVEIEAVAAELEAAQARIAELDQAERPLRITTKLVRQTIDGMNGILDHAPLATRVAWVRDLFERIDVDSRDEKAVAGGTRLCASDDRRSWPCHHPQRAPSARYETDSTATPPNHGTPGSDGGCARGRTTGWQVKEQVCES